MILLLEILRGACSVVFARPSWWKILGEKAYLGLPWSWNPTSWMPRVHMLDQRDEELKT
jgi:hypothetical protein